MSEFRFFAYTDFELRTNDSQNLLNLPITPYHATKRTTSDEISHELNVPYAVFEILVAIFAVVGNLMVIIVFQRERKLRRRTNYYIVSLAMADFLVGSLGIPFAILASVGLPSNLHACLFTVSLLVVLCTTSIFGLVAVSVDRYWAILYPMAYSRNVRTKTAIIIISMCWVAGTVVGFLPLFGWHADVGPDQACLFVEVMDYNYLVFLYFATIITPALLMLAFYTHIYRVIVRQVRQIVTMNPASDLSRRSSTVNIQMNTPLRPCHGGTMLRVLGAARKRDVKATQNLSIIVLFFMICWIPLYTINCIKAFCPDCYVHPLLTLFCIILSHLNSAVNPVLYAYHLKDFRAALKSLILRIMGVEIEQPVEIAHRYSLASQHRLQSVDANMRNALQPKIYIDSPIWLRQQQQQALKHSQLGPKCNVVSPCLNNTSVATDIEREMWNIMEASSKEADGDEIKYEFPDEQQNTPTATTTPTPPPRQHRRSSAKAERIGSQYSYENHNYSTSPEECELDEVFLPAKHEHSHTAIDEAKIASEMRKKLRSDDTEYESAKLYSTLTDSSHSEYEQANGVERKTPPPPPPPPPRQHKQQHHQRQEPLMTACTTSNGQLASPIIYVIDDDMDPLTLSHKSRVKRAQKASINVATRQRPSPPPHLSQNPNRGEQLTKFLSDSDSSGNSLGVPISQIEQIDCSGTQSHKYFSANPLNYCTYHPALAFQQQSRTGLFSPLKAVSHFIFPPAVKHSSLFHLFQPSTAHEPSATSTAAAAAPPIAPPATSSALQHTAETRSKSPTSTPSENEMNRPIAQRCSADDSTTTAFSELDPATPSLMSAADS